MLKALAIHTNSPVNVDHVVTFFYVTNLETQVPPS